jgi:hypothetical protein
MKCLRYIVLFAVACGSRNETTCEQVAESAMAIHPGAYRLTLEHCKANRWPESTRACTVAAKTRTEFTACRGAHLVVEAPPDLPKVADQIEHAAIVVEVHADGRLMVDNKPVTLSDLETIFAETAKRDADTQIVLEAEAATSSRHVNDIVQRANAAGLKHLAFASTGR